MEKLNVLVAEDNIINQKVASGILKRFGIIPDIVENGLEVIEALKQKNYDLILMDCQMPELDGYETTRRIVEEYPEANRPTIIALTASVTPEERRKCHEAGMDDIIPKPIDRKKLTLILESIQKKIAG